MTNRVRDGMYDEHQPPPKVDSKDTWSLLEWLSWEATGHLDGTEKTITSAPKKIFAQEVLWSGTIKYVSVT